MFNVLYMTLRKMLVTEDIFDKQSQWQISKYKIHKFSIRYSKVIVKEKRKKNSTS